MQVLYSDQDPFDGVGPSIFLAGPTPRSEDVISWRPKAIEILRRVGFEGTVLIPEPQNQGRFKDYTHQVQWEKVGLSKASVIVFWVPRNMETMPALTTNIEFGYWLAKSPSRVVYGRPLEAVNTRYLDWLYHEEKPSLARIHNTLESLLESAVEEYAIQTIQRG